MKKQYFYALILWAGMITSSFAQKVSVDVKQTKLETVLNTISKQTGYSFAYSTSIVDPNKKITISANDEELNSFLKRLCSNENFSFEIKDKKVFLTQKQNNSSVRSEKNKKITGKVTDQTGEAVIGANVVVQGTSTGTITDFDGNFVLEVPEEAKLKFSYIGLLDQIVETKGKSEFNIQLRDDSKALDEVVVVAYGTQKKVNLTAAVETVNTKVLNNRPVKSTAQMLEGVVPNLNISTNSGAPDASSSLNIRGFTGMGSKGGPLVLVDGVEQPLDFVNPNDIENISVLKDAAASAIYGSRAPYGVILITTKSGEKGKKASINYSGSVQFNKATMMPNSASSVQFANTLNAAFRNSLKDPYFNDELVQRMQDYIDGKIQDNNIILPNGRWGEHVDAHANSNYVDFAFKDVSVNTTHDLSISGGTTKSSYYAGLGYSYRDGIYNSDIDNFQKYSAILKLDTEITDWLSVGLNSRYVRQETERPNFKGANNTTNSDETFWNNLGYFPNIPIKNPDGSWHRLSAMPSLQGDAGKYNSSVDDLWLSGNIILRPTKDLTFKGLFSYNSKSGLDQRSIRQFFVNQPNNEILRSARSANIDQLRREQYRSNYITSDITGEYKKIIGKHDFAVLAGFQTEYKKNNRMVGVTSGMYNPEIPSFNISWGDNMAVSDEINHWATMGYFFSLSYNYNSRYLIDVKGRYDAASKYPKESRWAFFPSVSAGWNIARESFWPLEQISTFKVTGSFGSLGDQGDGNYLYIPTMGTSSTGNYILGGDRLPYVTMPGIVASEVTWAKPRSMGIGLEAAAFNNRLRGEYYWYQRTVYDQLGPSDKLPSVLGVTPPQTNNAISETRGWEISLSWRDAAFNIAGKRLNYSTRLIISDYIGYVVKYTNNTAGDRDTWTPGQVFGKIYGYATEGIATNKDMLSGNVLPGTGGWYYTGDLLYSDLNGDGRIDSGVNNTWYSMGDQKAIGWNYPRYKYAIQLGLDWSNFDFSILLDGVGKEERYLNNYTSFGHTGPWSSRYMFEQHAELGYWSGNNTNGFFPRAYQDSKNFSSVNDRYLIDLAHLRIKNISLSYSTPGNFAKKLGLESLLFNFSIENVGMIYYNSWLDLDPQMIRAQGAGYPIQRTFSLGFKIGL